MGDACINIHMQCTFADTSVYFCYACHLPGHHMKESTKEGGRPPLWIPLYGGWGGGKHSKNIQTYQQMCIEYVYWCIYLPYSFGIPIIPIIPYPLTSLVLVSPSYTFMWAATYPCRFWMLSVSYIFLWPLELQKERRQASCFSCLSWVWRKLESKWIWTSAVNPSVA